jgi:hypothetical protein
MGHLSAMTASSCPIVFNTVFSLFPSGILQKRKLHMDSLTRKTFMSWHANGLEQTVEQLYADGHNLVRITSLCLIQGPQFQRKKGSDDERSPFKPSGRPTAQ